MATIPTPVAYYDQYGNYVGSGGGGGTGSVTQSLTASANVTIGQVVTVSSAGACNLAVASAVNGGSVLGIANSTVASASPVAVTLSGPITLTPTQWDAVAGTTGGLTYGQTYYVSQTTNGNLMAVNASTSLASGTQLIPVGIAINTTTLYVYEENDWAANSWLTNQFGDGSDGNVTISSGTTTLVRDTMFNNLTLSGTGTLITNGFRFYVRGILDISAAQTGAIIVNTLSAGNSAAGASGGGGRNPISPTGNLPSCLGSAAGGNGAITIGSGGNSVNQTTGTVFLAGLSGGGGSGGASGTPNAGGGGGSCTNSQVGKGVKRWNEYIGPWSQAGFNPTLGGCGGGSGGGDGTNAGGGGGSGGPGMALMWLAAAFINRGSSSTAGIIQSKGCAGGNGANGVAGTAGGGAGGGGSGGGAIMIGYLQLLGSTITNAIDVTGGAGGNGGNGVSTGKGGGGGGAGSGGRVLLYSLSTGVWTDSSFNNAVASTTTATSTGATGAVATTSQVNL